MAGWNHANAKWTPKRCVVCDTEFVPKSGVNKFCGPKCKGKWKYVTGQGSTTAQYEVISENWVRYLSRLLYYGGRKRDQLTRDILLAQLKKQNYRCALTGVPLTCILEKGSAIQTNASVDRIQAGGAYSADNIQLVCRAVNFWRCNTPVDEFVEWCRKVVAYHDTGTLPDAQGEKENGHGQKA